jgi:hypothetical protein
MANAADGSARVRERAFAVPGAARSDAGLPRITETPYFIRKHHRVPARLVTDNPEVGSFSQCNRCHIGADRASSTSVRSRSPVWDAGRIEHVHQATHTDNAR